MGDDPLRFATPDGLLAFAGTVPAIDQSGSRSNMRRRDVRGNRPHQAVWHWASSAVVHEPGAKEYYWSRRAKGSNHAHVIRKVMIKLLRGVHMSLTTGTVWDDTRMWPTMKTKAEIDAYTADVKADRT